MSLLTTLLVFYLIPVVILGVDLIYRTRSDEVSEHLFISEGLLAITPLLNIVALLALFMRWLYRALAD